MKIAPIATCLVIAGGATAALAASDEIQVYTDDVHEPGTSGLELHTNYVFRGSKVPGYPGERAPDAVLRMTSEVSFGLAKEWDWGFYVPVAWDRHGSSVDFDGVKLRLKWLHKPGGEGDGWFYGENLEVGFNSFRTAPAHWEAEFRTIVGINQSGWQVTLNPILGVPISRSRDAAGLGAELDLKILREVGAGWSVGVEHYADLSLMRDLQFGDESAQATYLAVDWAGKRWDFNVGLGHGWTEPEDKLTLKAIFGVGF